MIPAIAFLVLLGPSAPVSAPHPLVGRWAITYPWHLEIENGVVRPTMETGELKVEAQGDSLIATLVTNPSAMFPRRRPLRLAALPGITETVFVMRDPVTLNLHGEQRPAIAISTWILRPNGGHLAGTLERRIEGIGKSHGRLALTGTRVGS